MGSSITSSSLLFETTDVFGAPVRTTVQYWSYIKTVKHQELAVTVDQVKRTLMSPKEVRRSIQDEHIKLFYKTFGALTLVVVVKYIQEAGFVVTVYQTSKAKRKGEKLWPK